MPWASFFIDVSKAIGTFIKSPFDEYLGCFLLGLEWWREIYVLDRDKDFTNEYIDSINF